MRQSLAVFILIAGCSSRPPIAIAEFSREYASAFCASVGRCTSAAGFATTQCEKDAAALFGDDLVRAASRIVYDANLARDCIEAVSAARCSAAGREPIDFASQPCLDALRGTRAPGASCSSLFECAHGLCVPEAAGTCPAKCPPSQGEGGSCNQHSAQDCDVRQGLLCVQGACSRPVPFGAACGINADCAGGLRCVGGHCGSLRRAGAGCNSDDACAPELYCVGGGDEATGSCHQRVGHGGACGQTDELADVAARGAQCAQGLVCRGLGRKDAGDPVAGTCVVPQDVGGACSTEPGGFQLFVTGCLGASARPGAGLLCADGSCVEPPASGACPPHSACRRGVSYCDPRSSTCQAVHAPGGPCARDIECASQSCAGGLCAPEVTLCHEG